jgi:hypothetical protein
VYLKLINKYVQPDVYPNHPVKDFLKKRIVILKMKMEINYLKNSIYLLDTKLNMMLIILLLMIKDQRKIF